MSQMNSGGDSIFTNEDEVIDGLRDSAAALGVNPDNVVMKQQPREQYLAKANCKKCFGQGLLTFIPSPQKKDTKEVKKKLPGVSENDINKYWNTSSVEPSTFKKDFAQSRFCGCVKKIMV